MAFVFLLAVLPLRPGGPVRAVDRDPPLVAGLAGAHRRSRSAYLAVYLVAGHLVAAPAGVRRRGGHVPRAALRSHRHPRAARRAVDAGSTPPTGAPSPRRPSRPRWVVAGAVRGAGRVTIWLRRGVAVRAWLLLLLYLALVGRTPRRDPAGLRVQRRGRRSCRGTSARSRSSPRSASGVALCGLRACRRRSPRRPRPGAAGRRSVARVRATPRPAGCRAVPRQQPLERHRIRQRLGDQGRPRLPDHRPGRPGRRAGRARSSWTSRCRRPWSRRCPRRTTCSRGSSPRSTATRCSSPRPAPLSVFDEAGHVRPAWVEGVTADARPGAGLRLPGDRRRSRSRIPLTGRGGRLLARGADRLHQRPGHHARPSGSATARRRRSTVHRGLNAMFLLAARRRRRGRAGASPTRRPTSAPTRSTIGALVPQPIG